MNEVLPFPPEENRSFLEALEQIENQELRVMLMEHLLEKGRNRCFLVDGQEISFAAGKTELKMLKHYAEKLINWAVDPFNPIDGNDGYGFELLLAELLKSLFKDSSAKVTNAPFTFDFLRREKVPEYAPSADIVIAEEVTGTQIIEPKALISASLSTEYSFNYNKALKVPVLNLSGTQIFGNGPEVTFYFGIAKHPKQFIEKKIVQNRAKLEKYLEQVNFRSF